MRVLLVEDELVTAKMIIRRLQQEEMQVEWVSDGSQVFDYLAMYEYDVVILDWLLPGSDGLTILQKIRKSGIDTPVLMLTQRDSMEDKIAGLENGADNYLVKPFFFPELLSRLKALARRQIGLWQDQASIGKLLFHRATRILSSDHTSVVLSKRETQLLEIFLNCPDQTMSRDRILNAIWGPGEASPNNADALVRLLRQRLAVVTGDVKISTIRGVGYRLITDIHDVELIKGDAHAGTTT